MTLGEHDLHLVLSRQSRTGMLWNASHNLLLSVEARNRTVRDTAPVNEKWAPCPAGEFVLGRPVAMGTAPFGDWFIALEDYGEHHTMAENHRSGIGIHGGGSGLPRPLIPFQGWVVTHGCWRLQNHWLQQLVNHVRLAQAMKGTVYVTVSPFAPGSSLEEVDDWFPVDEELLDPDE